jgi:hypothetical protein
MEESEIVRVVEEAINRLEKGSTYRVGALRGLNMTILTCSGGFDHLQRVTAIKALDEAQHRTSQDLGMIRFL